MARYNFGGMKGETRGKAQYVRFAYTSDVDHILSVIIFRREAKLKGGEYKRSKKRFYYILNEKGLCEEVSKYQPQSIEVKVSYDAKQRRAVPKEVKIKDKKYSIEELLESQVNYCQDRLNQGESGPNIGFVSYPSVYEYTAYEDYIKKIQEENSLGKKEVHKKTRIKNLKRGFGFGKKIDDTRNI